MGLRDAFVNIAKNAAQSTAQRYVTSVADGLRSGLGGSTSSSSSSPLQTGYKKQEPGILLYPSDVGTNMHQASYILFARHSVTGAKVKPITKRPPQAKPVMRQRGGPEGLQSSEQPPELDEEATARANKKIVDDFAAAEATKTGRGGAGTGGSSRSLVLQRRNIQKTGTFIGLYMPPSVNVSYSMDYSEGEIGIMGEALFDVFKAYQDGTMSMDTVTQTAGKAGQGLEKMGIGMIDTVIPGAKDLYAIERGAIITPRTEMMFRGVGRRSFSFTFTFIPKDKKESQTVHDIVQQFKIGMTPSFKSSGSVREMTIPDVFSIKYMHINNDNSYVNKIGKCFLKTMDVSYGGDKFVTYNPDPDSDMTGAPPQKTTITLAFQELEVLDRDNMERGF